ncbi:TIM barrel protein [Streptomyces sp. CB03238]|uniref:sugar phosphate isomerase/epimerase family protein n=1 Tax=Streptomyces sp. CB03238 TaxID=1907777 RepID=UPI0015C4D4DF|nr:TIM barrel protein [Streptomyces sp. CB03238]
MELCCNMFGFSPFIRSAFVRSAGPGAAGGEAVDPGELFDAVRAAGFTGVGLDLFTVDAWAGRGRTLAGVARDLAAAGLRCSEMLGFVVSDDAEGTYEGARRVAEAVAAFGAPYALGMVTAPPGPRTADLFARCAEVVADADGTAAVEFLPFTPLATIADARALVRHAGAGRAGVLVDTWHFFQGPDSWDELSALPAEELAYVQFNDHPQLLGADADLYHECMTRRVMPGDGVFPLDAFRDALTAKGYAGLVSVEVNSAELAALGPDEFARRAWAAARRYWS